MTRTLFGSGAVDFHGLFDNGFAVLEEFCRAGRYFRTFAIAQNYDGLRVFAKCEGVACNKVFAFT